MATAEEVWREPNQMVSSGDMFFADELKWHQIEFTDGAVRAYVFTNSAGPGFLTKRTPLKGERLEGRNIVTAIEPADVALAGLRKRPLREVIEQKPERRDNGDESGRFADEVDPE